MHDRGIGNILYSEIIYIKVLITIAQHSHAVVILWQPKYIRRLELTLN